MLQNIAASSVGYTPLEFTALIDKDLKAPLSLTVLELSCLSEHRVQWRSELINMKKRTEFQLTSSKARQFSLYREKLHEHLTELQYVDKLHAELAWRCNATRFVQQLETRIAYVMNLPHD